MKRRPKVGEIVYSLNIGRAAIYQPEILTEMVVVKVGWKFFYCQLRSVPTAARYAAPQYRYFLKTWWEAVPNDKATSFLYANPQEWEDAKEFTKTLGQIRQRLCGRGHPLLPLSVLRQIKGIIDNYRSS